MALKDLSVKIGADTRGFDRGLKRVSSGLSSLVKTGLGLAGIGLGLKGIADSMRAYVGLESSVMRVNSLFGDAAKYVTFFASNTAKGFGMAESSAYQYAAVYGNLFRNITASAEENSKVTIAMLKASSVVASKTGRTMEDVMERIRSGLLGNTEAIEDLGINVNVAMLESTDAFRRLADGRSWEKLSFYEQQQIRTLAILEQAQKSFGTEVQRGGAFSLSILSGAFKDLVSSAGMFVNAGLQPVIAGLTQLVQWATAGLKALAALMGLQINASVTATSGVQGQTDAQAALTDETKATAKAQGDLTGFDEVNTLADKSAAGGVGTDGATGGGPFAGIAMPEFEVKELDTSPMEKSLEKFKALFDFSGIQESWAKLKAALTPLGENIGAGLKWLWDNVLVPFSQWAVNDAIPAFMNFLAGAFSLLNPLVEVAKPLLAWLWESFLVPIATWTGGIVVGVLSSLGEALTIIGDWVAANGEAVRGWAIGLGVAFAGWQLMTVMADVQKLCGPGGLGELGTALRIIAEDRFPVLKTGLDCFKLAIDTAAKGAKDFAAGIWETIQGAWAFLVEIGKQTAALIANSAQWVWSKVCMLGSAVAQGAMTAATAVWNVVCSIATGVTTAFGAAVAFLTSPIGLVVVAIGALIAIGVLLYKNWDTIKVKAGELWDGIKKTFAPVADFFGDIWDSVKKGFVSFVNFIIRGINTMIKGVLAPVNALISGWNNTVGRVTGQIPTISFSIPEIPQLARGGIVDSPTLAMIGERGKEAVVPLENTGFVTSLANAVASAVGTAMLQVQQIAGGGNHDAGQGRELAIYMDTKLVARAIIPAIDSERSRTGLTPVIKAT